MKLNISFPSGPLVLGALLLTGPALQAEKYDLWTLLQPYDLGGWNRSVPIPEAGASLNTFLPENSGQYVAIWDLTNGTARVERRNMGNEQVWTWSPPEPKPDPLESTRAVIAGPNRLLWASSQRWFYLDLANGTVVRSNDWSLPYLDATKFVPQNDLLYVLFADYASIYDTNMERVGTIQLNWPEGYWRAYAGTWMVDLSQRTTRLLRVARLGAGLAVTGISEVPFSHSRPGGYLEHRVLGANTNGLFVASSLNWPDTTITYFTYLRPDGTVGFQHRVTANQMITGVALLNNGWLVSAQFLGEPTPRHVLYRVDNLGRPHWQVLFASDPTQQNVILNTNPPRLLRLNNADPWEVRRVDPVNWWTIWTRLLWDSRTHGVELYWDSRAFDISGLIGDTNYFWREPVRPNNT